MAEEWLHLLAGWLGLLWDPGMDTAGHQEALPGIWSARQATLSRNTRTGSRMHWHQVHSESGERGQKRGQWLAGDNCPSDPNPMPPLP